MKDNQNYFHEFLHIKYDDFYIETSSVEDYSFYKYFGEFWKTNKHKNVFYGENFLPLGGKIFNSSVGLDGLLDEDISKIKNNTVELIVTSTAFSDTVKLKNSKYHNQIIERSEDWKYNISKTFQSFYSILKPQTYFIFEVDNFYSDDEILEILKTSIENNFDCLGVIYNYKEFDKTSHINNTNYKLPNNVTIIFQRVD